MDDKQPLEKTAKALKLNMNIDFRLIIILLLVVIAGMLFAWKPWETNSPSRKDQVITVTGESKIVAEPDEFVFNPVYEFKNTDKEAALAELTKKNKEVITSLKALGLADNKIKTNSDGHNYGYYFDQPSGQNTYSLRLTVTTDSKDVAEKVQNYLVNTSPMGTISPQATFSNKKRNELESKARDEATYDARSKAEQSARNLNFKIGKVKSVKDGMGFDGIMPFYGGQADKLLTTQDSSRQELSIQPGENELTYSVEVVYYLR